MKNQLFNLKKAFSALETIAIRFDQSSPVVGRWANEIFDKIYDQDWREVTLEQLRCVEDLASAPNANTAQNILFKHLDRIGADTTGLASF